MYTPVKDGIEKSVRTVRYTEAKPPSDLAQLVYCFWELRTTAPLIKNYSLHAIPDACVDIMFNEIDVTIAGVTALRTTYEVLNLGKEFHYVGIEFMPGVWRGNQDEIARQYVGDSYAGSLPLVETNSKMITLSFPGKQQVMADLVRQLADKKMVIANPLIERILSHITDIHTVTDMAAITATSPRQLQRSIKQATGFSPRDFLKVLRLQRSFSQDYSLLYTDQSHFIRSFKAITGYTPAHYFNTFDV